MYPFALLFDSYACTYIIDSYIHMYIIAYYVLYCNFTLAIDQVTGVTLTCRPVGLINQCTVIWNVSFYKQSNNLLLHEILNCE